MRESSYTLEDYMNWRQDVPFSLDPFNDVDNLILCGISYLSFNAVLPTMVEHTGMSLKDCYETGQVIANQESEEFCEKRLENFKLAATSKRFQDIEVGNYIDILSTDISMQFAAMTFKISDDLMVVAFRGTGNTIIGWKEDFMMSFTKIEAQIASVEYLNKVIDENSSCKYIVAGHSKGANLAVYAAANLSKEKQDKIIKIYNNDGPGFCKDVIDLSIIDAIKDKVVRIEPGYCVVGKLFEVNYPDTTIVKSYENGVTQHDIATWMVDGPRLCKIEENESGSIWLSRVFKEWIEGIESPEKRKEFVDAFFGSLMAGGATTMDQVTKDGLEQVVKAMVNSSDTAKGIAWELPKTAVKTSVDMVSQSINESITKLKESAENNTPRFLKRIEKKGEVEE